MPPILGVVKLRRLARAGMPSKILCKSKKKKYFC
jgi:hypothetical protein